MALRKWGFIYVGPGLVADLRVLEVPGAGTTLVAVGVDNEGDCLTAARAMVGDGCQLIELCGAFGPEWAARVADAVDHAVPVGAVYYPASDAERLVAIFADEAAAAEAATRRRPLRPARLSGKVMRR